MSNAREQGSSAGITRRTFLKATGAATAGLAMAPVILGAEAKAAPKEINIALIGAGAQGFKMLTPQILKIPGVRFKAVCDIWPYFQGYAARFLKSNKHEVNVYADYQDMLAKEKGLDAAIVATPDWMHAEHSIACMKAGLHVYCEKEMSNDIAKAKEMVLASRETKRLLQIGHQRRSNPRYLFSLQKIIQEAKLLGRITQVYGQWNKSVEASMPRGAAKGIEPPADTLKKYGYDSLAQFLNWRWYKKYGSGPIADLGAHQIDVFGWFLGAEPSSVMAAGGKDYFKDYEWYDNVMCIYEFPTASGMVRALYEVLTTTSARSYYESFMGTDGTLNLSERPGQCRLYAEGHLTPSEEDAKKGVKHPWEPWVKKGYIIKLDTPDEPKEKETKPDVQAIIDVYKSPPPTVFLLNKDVESAQHTAHLENFFAAIRGEEKLNCPGEVGYATAVQVLRVNEAVAARKVLEFKPEEFKA